ncbi:FAD-binding domain-containing protein [Plastoroseomonas arctica]|uniref:Cryptochrome/DNA photolyase FAD-binding domain-containing protein n=1 Tax=Plastoroseomonas arctica TaxID=1509237 RepID=A0AAF1JZJ1_9PROT|nr:FAD-binding domain-containing protein [Plastoroseomonas arctica]MBR0655838.1 hypothetical protein [Plastoroseomonas arctica]
MMTPSRAAGLARLARFAPRMGRAYAEGRNHDPGAGADRDVSLLSPWVRHRLVMEHELVLAALDAHGAEGAEKFIHEVFWRSYWKGWLELRPGVWASYRTELAAAEATSDYVAAVAGETGIACFDAWARELRETGYLHNHARMWFASIWIFTLRLPWVLGADFFLRHLLDGDAASNTLSWRWVAGIQTRGNPYAARADNIARFTAGRFNPVGQLNETPTAIAAPEPPPPMRLAPGDIPPDGPVGLLLHEDDLHPESLGLGAARVVALAGFALPARRSPRPVAAGVIGFTQAAMADALHRAEAHFGVPGEGLAIDGVVDWGLRTGLRDLVTPYAPVGWVADAMAPLGDALAAHGIRLHRVMRDWDAACWPLATKGFFAFREHIPSLIGRLVRP